MDGRRAEEEKADKDADHDEEAGFGKHVVQLGSHVKSCNTSEKHIRRACLGQNVLRVLHKV